MNRIESIEKLAQKCNQTERSRISWNSIKKKSTNTKTWENHREKK